MYVHYRAANVLCQGSDGEFAFYRGQIRPCVDLAARNKKPSTPHGAKGFFRDTTRIRCRTPVARHPHPAP